MTALEREKRNEKNRKVRGEKYMFLVELTPIPHNKSYFCVRETTSGYYVQSFDTIVLYVSKNGGKLTRCWAYYTRATICHINKALQWIDRNTETKPRRLLLSGRYYSGLPYRQVDMIAA